MISLSEQLQALETKAGLYDASASDFLSIQGSDASDFLQKLTTNDVKNLPIGQLQYSALLDRKAKVQALFILLRQSESAFLMILPGGVGQSVHSQLSKMIFIQDVALSDESAKWGLLWTVGPEAQTLVGECLGVHGDMLAAENKLLIPPDQSAWHLWRSERWSQPSVGLLLPQGQVSEAKDLILSNEVNEIDQTALDLVRLAGGITEFGVEVTSDHALLETQLLDTFSRNKGCYPGQEIVERLCAYGEGKTPKQILSAYIPGEHDLAPGNEIVSGDKTIGQVIRALYNPNKQSTMVVAYLESKFSEQVPLGTVKEGQVYV